MPNEPRRIDELDALTPAIPALTDVLPISNPATGPAYKVTVYDLLAAIGTETRTTCNVNTNNLTINKTQFIYLENTSGSAKNLTGVNSTDAYPNKIIYITNNGADNIDVLDEDANSSAANRFNNGGATVTLQPDSSASWFYDDTAQRWRFIG